jgi:beta-alanine--pyruvate transaminase
LLPDNATLTADRKLRAITMNDIARPNNLDAFWMPYTANRSFKAAPRMLARAAGMYYYTNDNREVLDGTAGLWCCNAGHGRREIVEAIQAQAAVMDFAPTFQMGHPIAFQAAARLAEITPDGMDRIFFTNSGSESADTALKIALAYHRARGEAGRVRMIGRERGYHGVGFGGMSVGGIGGNRKQFGALLPYVDHLPHTLDMARNAFSTGLPAHGAELADALENLVALHGAETIAAVMVEPVAGSTGVLPPPQGYLARLRSLCDKHGILLIFDEVITGFGRLGANFAADRLGVTPDVMTMAKGLTNAAVPMGAVAVREGVYDAIVHGRNRAIPRLHLFRPPAGQRRRHRLDGSAAHGRSAGPRPCDGAVFRARRPCPARPAERDRYPQRRAGCWDRTRAPPRPADRPGDTGVPTLLRCRAADPHHRRYHRPFAAADH